MGGSRFRATVAAGLIDSIIKDGSGGLPLLGYLLRVFEGFSEGQDLGLPTVQCCVQERRQNRC